MVVFFVGVFFVDAEGIPALALQVCILIDGILEFTTNRLSLYKSKIKYKLKQDKMRVTYPSILALMWSSISL